MNKTELLKLSESGLSTYAISKETGKSQTTIRYWMNKYKLKSQHPCKKNGVVYALLEEKKCSLCKKTKPIIEFYKSKKNKGNSSYHSYCKPCVNLITSERLQKIKIKCIEYKGGKCICCGYKKYYGALEFHHKNPKQKDFSIGTSCMSFKNLKKELDKCVLVCSNCHREIHAGLINLSDFI